AGTTQNAYVQVGHGGRLAKGDHSGNILVQATGSIIGTAGTSGVRTSVMIGHGGSEAGSGTGVGNSGSIDVRALTGSLTFTAGGGAAGQARIGHGGHLTGGNHQGNIAVSAASGITLTGGAGNRALAQIGHGGGLAAGQLSGDIYLNLDPV